MLSLQIKVAALIKDKAPQQVEDKVVDALVAREVSRRSDALTKAIDEYARIEGEIKRIKPDVVTYNIDKSIKDSSYSKAKVEELEKLNKKLDKHEKAITKALEDKDYGDLYNLGKSDGNSDKTGDSSKSGGEEG